jgi:hypothetical protein
MPVCTENQKIRFCSIDDEGARVGRPLRNPGRNATRPVRWKSCARASGTFLQLRIVMPGGDPRLAACCVPINDFPVVRDGPLFRMVGVVNFLRPVERPVHGSLFS